MQTDDALRQHILDLLRSATERRFEQVVRDFPMDAINTNPPNVEYSPWQLLEHLRMTQWDLLDYMRNPNYVAPPHPDGYWPPLIQQATAEDWTKSVESFRADRNAIQAIVSDPGTDLMATMPHTPGHTVLREAFLAVRHCEYHMGEFGILRQVMGTWPADHR